MESADGEHRADAEFDAAAQAAYLLNIHRREPCLLVDRARMAIDDVPRLSGLQSLVRPREQFDPEVFFKQS